MKMIDMLAELQGFYDEKGISSTDFRCKHHAECRNDNEQFTEAKAALVGREYQTHKLPRLLFISLDSGSGNIATNNTITAVEEAYYRSNTNRAKNRHWYRTHEIACEILKEFDSNITIESVKGWFAHTNSAKCCMNKTGRRKADKILFKNCMEFMSEEVSILNPDIIITQGLEAHYSLKNKFPKLENVANVFQNDLSEVSVIVINNHPVLWIRTYHPGNWGKFNKVTMESLPAYAKISHEFIKATN